MPYLEPSRAVYFRHWPATRPAASVLILHGFGEHSGHYHRLAFAMNAAGLDAWAVDHIGHGLSGGERGRFPSVDALVDNAERVLELIHAHAPCRPVVLVGHSLGGVTAALLADRRPELAALVLTGTPLSGLPADAPAEPVMSLDEFYLDALETDPLGFDTAPAEAALWDAIAHVVPDLEAIVPTVQVPTLFVNGEHDAFAPPAQARAWAARMKDAQVLEITGGHHDIVNDVAHHEVADAISRFIHSHLAVQSSTGRPDRSPA